MKQSDGSKSVGTTVRRAACPFLVGAAVLAVCIGVRLQAASGQQKGKIVLSYRGQSMLIVVNTSTNRQLQLSTTNGVISMPAGTYRLLAYVAMANDRNKIKWSAYGQLADRKPITVKSNSSQKLDLGPPLTASVKVTPKGGNEVGMGFELVGRGGDIYVITREDGETKPPIFEVRNQSGKVVMTGSFAYG